MYSCVFVCIRVYSCVFLACVFVCIYIARDYPSCRLLVECFFDQSRLRLSSFTYPVHSGRAIVSLERTLKIEFEIYVTLKASLWNPSWPNIKHLKAKQVPKGTTSTSSRVCVSTLCVFPFQKLLAYPNMYTRIMSSQWNMQCFQASSRILFRTYSILVTLVALQYGNNHLEHLPEHARWCVIRFHCEHCACAFPDGFIYPLKAKVNMANFQKLPWE